jgi:hypothetical protein
MLLQIFQKSGDVAQLEEHFVRNEGVASSTLVISTKNKKWYNPIFYFFIGENVVFP